MYNKKTHFHFIGIGGIGMSALAKIFISQGYNVSGCDKNIEQKSIIDLKKIGCLIADHHNSTLCNNPDISTIVYSTDIPHNNPEIERAKKLNIPIVHRSLILAELMKRSFAIGVAGSHGKTTTSSLISHIFLETDQNPTIIIGGHLHSIQSNAQWGSGPFLIAETDESDRSLLNLFPTFAVLTNIDLEHMNVYANLHDITTTFKAYLEKIPFYGKAFVCIDDLQIQSLLPLKNINTVSYGLNTEAEWSLKNLSLQSGRSQYTLIHNQQEIGSITLNIPGEHNALNSLAAIAVAYESGIPLPAIIKALSTFTGVDRRFTYRGSFKNIGIFDDYGHHPTEIACTLKNALQQASGKPLTVIFQPHRYTRTHSLWKQFIELFAFAPIDTLIITDLYSANEEPIEGITSKELSEAIHNKNPQCNVHYIPYENDHKKIITFLEKNTPTDGLLLLQGAGSVTKIIDSLLEK